MTDDDWSARYIAEGPLMRFSDLQRPEGERRVWDATDGRRTREGFRRWVMELRIYISLG